MANPDTAYARWGGGPLRVVMSLAAVLLLSPAAANSEEESLLLAQASVWDTYKRIRRGEAEVGDSSPDASSGPDETPAPAPAASPAPPPPAPAPRAVTDQRLPATPTQPQSGGAWWAWFRGEMPLPGRDNLGPYGRDFDWAYARREPLPPDSRVLVYLHDEGEGTAAVDLFAPAAGSDIELRVLDAGAYDPRWREWWIAGTGGVPYPGRRIAAALEFLSLRYGAPVKRGIVLTGEGMGATGALAQAALLPSPWRERVAWLAIRGGQLPRAGDQAADPVGYPAWPDSASDPAFWRAIDIAQRLGSDPVLQGLHMRGVFSSGSAGADDLLTLVNALERHRVGGSFAWVSGENTGYERGVRLPDLSLFETPEQDVSLERAHPAITHSTGNYPATARERLDVANRPRGHYNLGIHWDHTGIVDEPGVLVFPLAYRAHRDLGGALPDQPDRIEVSVTPRRLKNFSAREGQTLDWEWDGGVRSGTVVVSDGRFTIDGVPLVSGAGYGLLRIRH